MSSVSVSGGTLYLKQDSGGPVVHSVDGTNWSTFTWPLTIINTDTSTMLRIMFVTDLVLDDSMQYFICGSDMIQFGSESLREDGIRYTCTMSGTFVYGGLVWNGNDSTLGYLNIHVYNLAVLAADSSVTLDDYGGWIGRAYFGHGASANRIVNCFSDGDIPIGGGGIVGQYVCTVSGNIVIRGCSSTGIIGILAGGIAGSYAGDDNGTVIIRECFSTGAIYGDGGGIFGFNAGRFGGTVIASDCYSEGSIDTGAGGIYGIYAGSSGGNATAENCYSKGNINNDGGGIFGAEASYNFSGGVVTANNCYSTGTIGSGAGGIFGAGYEAGIIATHCYTAGSGGTGGIFSGSSDDNLSPYGSNNYSEMNRGGSGWSTTNANNTLVVSGGLWIEVDGTDTPFELTAMGYTPYTIANINPVDGSLIRTYSQTVVPGATTVASYLVGYTFTILSGGHETITIDNVTGTISTTAATPVGTYTLLIRHHINPYSITTFALTVEATAASTNTLCCEHNEEPANLYEFMYEFKAGKRMVLDRAGNPNLKFGSYSEYLRYRAALG